MDCIHVEGDPEPVEDIQHNENKAKTNTPDPTIWAGTARMLHNNDINEMYNLISSASPGVATCQGRISWRQL